MEIQDTNPILHLTTALVAGVLLVLSLTDMLVRRSRLRRNLPLLTGWILVGKLCILAGSLWMLCYFAWVFFSASMSDYTLTQAEYRRLKGRLTRALNSKDYDKIIKEAKYAQAIFEEKGSPDDWSRWQRALDDAEVLKWRTER